MTERDDFDEIDRERMRISLLRYTQHPPESFSLEIAKKFQAIKILRIEIAALRAIRDKS